MNIPNHFKKRLIFILGIILLFAQICIFTLLIKSISKDKIIFKIVGLNNITPTPIDYFWFTNIRNDTVNKNSLRYQADYYELLYELNGPVSGLEGLLGYIYYYLDNKSKSEEFFNKALKSNPDYFWYYYDLGIIYLERNDKENANKYFKCALNTDIERSIKSIINPESIYIQIINKHIDSPLVLVNRVNQGINTIIKYVSESLDINTVQGNKVYVF